MKKLTFVLILAWASLSILRAQATAQMPDSIVIEGQRYSLTTLPLEEVLKDKQGFPPKDAAISSANWRGYIADWKIDGKMLYLTDVTIRQYDEKSRDLSRRSVLSSLFPDQAQVPASWYSGALVIPEGELVDYVHMGFGSSYTHYRIYRIERGRVVELLSLDRAEFEAYRDRKFEEFKKTSSYRKQMDEMKKEMDDLSEERRESFMKSFYAEDYLAQ